MKIKVKTKDCRLIVTVKTSGKECIDERELDRFSRAFMRGFLRPRLIRKSQIEYTGPVGISLYDRFKRPISKRDFLFVIEQIIVAVQKLYANNFPIINLHMDIRNTYINESTKEVQFVYTPLTIYQRQTNLIEFLETVVYSVKPEREEDTDYISRFLYFFRSISPFDINKLEKFVIKEDKSVVSIIRKQNAGQSGFMTNKQQHYVEHYEQNSSANTDDDPTGLLDDDPTGLLEDEAVEFVEDEETALLIDEETEATGLLLEDDEDTALLDEDEEDVHYPTLYRVITEENISIDKPVFRLGKEKSYVDYFVTNNIAVSRSHADIISRGNRYFVKDLNSKNHTYINGQMIPVQCEVEIFDGDKLRLGNEEFVFYV
ncbi:MAG: FHA domain-containing protein [Ruminococcus sp.]|nr:FHA domain-containing protein [Ruminococcus sp.]